MSIAIQDTFEADMFMAGYLGLGSYCFDGSAVLEDCDIDRILREGSESQYAIDVTEALAEKIRLNYFAGEKTIIKFDFANASTYGNIEKWHSDAEYIFPGQNATINCFFDDTSPETGGQFEITPYSQSLFGTKTHSDAATITFPKKFSIIVFNQNRNWLHKVVPSTQPRRMLSFAAQFCEFNHVVPNFI